MSKKDSSDISEILKDLDNLYSEYLDICQRIGIDADPIAHKIIKAKKDVVLFILGKRDEV